MGGGVYAGDNQFIGCRILSKCIVVEGYGILDVCDSGIFTWFGCKLFGFMSRIEESAAAA